MAVEDRKELIKEIEKRLKDNIIEKTNADILIKLIENAEDLKEAIAIAELGTTYKRTGFHFDKRLEKKGNTIKYFKKNKELSFSDGRGGAVHKLIIGDNYDALLNLLIEYRRRIDVIYIDPPYGKDSMGQFAKTNYNNAITRDNLLSMLYPRLFLAKQILSDDGVIFISIDDRNQAYIKCLADEIFGENNFICNIVWTNSEGGGGSDSRFFKVKQEYVLCYAKNSDTFSTKNVEIEDSDRYKLKDEYYNIRGMYQLVKLSSASIQYSKSLDYEIIMPDNTTVIPKDNTNKDKACWRWSKDKLQWGIENDFVVYKKDKNNIWQVYTKQYINCDKDGNIIPRTKKPLALINKFSSTQASNCIIEIFRKKVFSYSKPAELIQWLIDRIPNKNAIILDFFAGSGTTGQAVFELNRQDSGNRQFIGVQLPENLDDALKNNPNNQTIQNQINLCDENSRPHYLSEITAERLRRIMTGSSYNGSKDFKWIQNNDPYGGTLDVYEMEQVSNIENQPGKSAFEVIEETLYGKEKFKTLKEKTDWVCNNFEGTQRYIETAEEQQKRLEG